MSVFGFSINRFIAEIAANGTARTNRYEILFGSTRSGGPLFNRAAQEKLNSRLESLSLPASTIGSNPVKLQSIDREMPYGRIYEGDITLTFLEDRDFRIRKIFESWQKRVIDDITYQCGYYDEYICEELDVAVLDETNKGTYNVKLFDLFPKSINAIELSGGDEGLVKTSVALSFRRWKSGERGGDVSSPFQLPI